VTRCESCGLVNTDDAVFCAGCHHFLAWSGDKADDDGARDEESPGGAVAARRPAAPPSSHQPPAPPPSSLATGGAGAPGLLAAIAHSSTMAESRARPDLYERLSQARRRFDERTVTVAVVGEFKRGKSTLVNALIQTAVCPVDADIVTAVPTLVRYGEDVVVSARVHGAGTSEPATRTFPFGELAALVSEASDSRRSDVLSVEIQVPHRILRSGLQLLDTPGVGGLDSVHGQLSLASLLAADAILFVTDASQELTAPELEFLRSALDRCPRAAFVVTKTDLHPQWRRIVELDAGHLSRAGLDLPIIPVSSFLRLRAVSQPELNEESGFASLMTFLARKVVQGAAAEATRRAAHEVDFVATQLAQQTDAERVVIAEPRLGASVVGRLDRASRRTEALAAPNATWQQVLSDGVQDLVADVEHDLQGRLRAVLRDVQGVIDQSDPRTTWTETEAWLTREAAAAAVANHALLVQRATELADAVAEQFDLEANGAIELDLTFVTRALEERHLPPAASLSMPGGRLASWLITARTGSLLPLMAYSIGTRTDVSGLLLGAAATVLGAGITGRLFKGEAKRQRSYRQGQAKAAAAKFVEEVAFEMNKETRDALRRAQRQLRDEFHSRATSLHASAAGALNAAQGAVALAEDARVRRAAQLDDETTRLRAIRASLREISGSENSAPVGVGHG